MKKLMGAALLLQVLFFVPAKAQFQDIEPKYTGQLRSKTLLVPTVEEVTRTLLDLQKKPDELADYKNGVANFNAELKAAVQKYAKFAKAIEFLPQTKVNNILKEGNTKYLVMQYGLREGSLKPLMFSQLYADSEYTTDRRRISKAEGYGMFQLEIPVKAKDPEVIYTVFLPVAYPSQGDMIYAMQMITNQLATIQKQRAYTVSEFDQEAAKNNQTLKNRTLLLDATQLDIRTKVEDFAKAYPNPVRVVDYSEINSAIMENDSSIAYVQIVPMAMPDTKIGFGTVKTPLMHLVIDAGNGKVLGKARVTRMDYDKLATDISKKEIKEYYTAPEPVKTKEPDKKKEDKKKEPQKKTEPEKKGKPDKKK